MFDHLNKAVSVPDLYIDPTNEVDKNFVHEIIEKIIKKWPKMEGGRGKTGRCQIPNTTRSKLNDQIYNHFKHKMVDINITTDQVMTRIEQLNNGYKNNTQFLNSFKSNTVKKCKDNNCYIFLKDFTEDLNLT